MTSQEIIDAVVSVRCGRDIECKECWTIVDSVIKNIETAGMTIQSNEEIEMETGLWETEPEVEEEIVEAEVVAPPVLACRAPAPLVVNGAAFVGCILPEDHEGPHEVRVTWAR